MHAVCFDGSFAGWREAARTQLRRGMAPHQLSWVQDSQENHDLFGQLDEPQPTMAVDRPVRVPRALIDQLEVGGMMLVPVGTLFQEMTIVRKTASGVTEQRTIPVRFVPMVNKP